jgi:hypothetical protein
LLENGVVAAILQHLVLIPFKLLSVYVLIILVLEMLVRFGGLVVVFVVLLLLLALVFKVLGLFLIVHRLIVHDFNSFLFL